MGSSQACAVNLQGLTRTQVHKTLNNAGMQIFQESCLIIKLQYGTHPYTRKEQACTLLVHVVNWKLKHAAVLINAKVLNSQLQVPWNQGEKAMKMAAIKARQRPF